MIRRVWIFHINQSISQYKNRHLLAVLLFAGGAGITPHWLTPASLPGVAPVHTHWRHSLCRALQCAHASLLPVRFLRTYNNDNKKSGPRRTTLFIICRGCRNRTRPYGFGDRSTTDIRTPYMHALCISRVAPNRCIKKTTVAQASGF